MKQLLIKAGYKTDYSVPTALLEHFEQLPEKIGLISTIQFSDFLKAIKKKLEKAGKKVFLNGTGMILGCNAAPALAVESNAQAFLYIGSGKFHLIQMAMSLKKQKRIFIFNPLTEEFSEISWNEVEKFKTRKEVSKVRFLSADYVGLLVSTKWGQLHLDQALKLKEKTEKGSKDKKVYIFLFDEFQEEQRENWPEIKSWVNTACPGIGLDSSVAWIGDVL
jgi:diphthamide biosynthesis enzyme Dph1/Dph2-like protein